MKLKNLISNIFCLLVISSSIAAPIDSSEAKQLAISFIENQLGSSADNVNLLQTHFQNTRNQRQSAFFICNFDHGFVIISGNNATIPILAYSTENSFDGTDMPEGLQVLLQSYQSQIESIDDSNIDLNIARQWQDLRDGASRTRQAAAVNPLLQTTWGQTPVYNMLCPADAGASSGHAVAGCIAVAMAQVMRFWQSPFNGFGDNGYSCGNYGYQYADFENTSYLYPQMPNEINANSPEDQKNAVARLIYHCGVAVNMVYGPTTSSAYALGNAPSAVHALNHYFGYGDAMGIRRNTFPNDNAWIDTLERQLDHGFPIILTGYSPENAGHTFVCDGYNASHQFHINWGWRGAYNAYYTITSLTPGEYNYSLNQNAIINLYPTQTASIMVSPNSLTFTPSNDVDSVQVEGVLLHNDINVAGAHPFLVSLDKNSWDSHCVLDSTGGKFYVKYLTSTNMADSASITISSNNVSTKHVKVKGYSAIDTIFASAIGGAIIEPEGTILVPRNSNKTFYFHAADTNHVFNFLNVDENIFTEETNSYTFSNIQGNHSITAVFRELIPTIISDNDTMNFEVRLGQYSHRQAIHIAKKDFSEPISLEVSAPYSISTNGNDWGEQCEIDEIYNTVYVRFHPENIGDDHGYMIMRTEQTQLCDSVTLLGKLSPYNIYLYSNNGGSFERDENLLQVTYDTTVTVRFSAHSNYRIAQVIVDEADCGAIDSVVFSNVAEDHFIYVMYQDRSVDIQNIDLEDIAIYPNPTSDYLKINFGEETQNIDLQIFDLNGRILMHEQIPSETTIDMQGFAEGTYIFVFKLGGWSTIRKVVKLR